jgi:hypothetical protein
VAAATWLWSCCALAGEPPRVILLRGWFTVFSTGLDNLADDLKSRGINAEAFTHFHWSTAITDILRDRAAGKSSPLVLVGHSQGANNVIDIARALAPHDVNIDLLVTLAPLLQDPVPPNVLRAINYYQSPGWGARVTAEPGFHGSLVNIDVSDDWTILHISMDKSRRVQTDILREILALSQVRDAGNDMAVPRRAVPVPSPRRGTAESRQPSRPVADAASPSAKRAPRINDGSQ